MGFFKRSPDPFANELRRLEKAQRKLEQEESRLRQLMQTPPAPAATPVEIQDSHAPKGAVFRPDPFLSEDRTNNRRKGKRLKVQNQSARNRFIGVCLLILLLALIVYRTMQ